MWEVLIRCHPLLGNYWQWIATGRARNILLGIMASGNRWQVSHVPDDSLTPVFIWVELIGLNMKSKGMRDEIGSRACWRDRGDLDKEMGKYCIFFILYTYESLKNKEKYSQEKSEKDVVTYVFTLKTLERRSAGLSRFHTSQNRVLTN